MSDDTSAPGAPARQPPLVLVIVVVLAAGASVVLPFQGVNTQRRLDGEIATVVLDARRYEYVIKRNDERQALTAHARQLAVAAAAPAGGAPPEMEPPASWPSSWPDIAEPGPPTWNPFRQRAAIRERLEFLEAWRAVAERGRALETRFPELEHDVEAAKQAIELARQAIEAGIPPASATP